MLDVLLAAAITGNSVCWMQDASGRIINLDSLCSGSPAIMPSSAIHTQADIDLTRFMIEYDRLTEGSYTYAAMDDGNAFCTQSATQDSVGLEAWVTEQWISEALDRPGRQEHWEVIATLAPVFLCP